MSSDSGLGFEFWFEGRGLGKRREYAEMEFHEKEYMVTVKRGMRGKTD